MEDSQILETFRAFRSYPARDQGSPTATPKAPQPKGSNAVLDRCLAVALPLRRKGFMSLWLIHIAVWRVLHEAAVRSVLEFLDYQEEKGRRGI